MVGKVDTTFFTKRVKGDLFVCKINVDDIIFGSTHKAFSDKMSMMEELKLFLRFQIKQLKEGTFISQSKYNTDMIKKFEMGKAKKIKIPMPTSGNLNLDQGGKVMDQKLYLSMIGSLLCLYASRPDSMLNIRYVCKISSRPKRELPCGG